jgi:hypothetical protein
VGGALALALAALFAGIGCQGGYPIPASQCDQWCDAFAPALCSSYDPAECVLSCSQRGGDATECHAELETLLACLRSKSPHELACETWGFNGTQQPCFGEEQSYEECTSPYAKRGSSWR